jgi:N-acyl-D-aspartate/D-glutamate deacylase
MLDYLIKNAQIVDGTGETPFNGDIGIADGVITEVGNISAAAKETINADGAYATPGWVDVHTHFDGQVSWDDKMDPSASHGVTSVVMGNCGVGFAPAPPGGEQRLIELMEGVEDIPGTALYEGIEWGRWETFPEYLDYLDTRKFALDVGAQIPHSAVRNYVMGDRALSHEDATAADLEAMCTIVSEGLEAGALGFSTSRTIGHRSVLGEPIPGTFAEKAELLAIARAMRSVNKGVFQAVPAGVVGELAGPEKYTTEQEVALFTEVAKECGRACTFTLAQNGNRPDLWRTLLDMCAEANANGIVMRPQVASRPIGFVTSLRSYHMFMRRETYLKIAHLPMTELLAEMRKPEVKAAILSDQDIAPDKPGSMENLYQLLGVTAGMMFPIELPINYEPEVSGNIAALAAGASQEVDAFLYDFLTRSDGNVDVIHEMLTHKDTVIGLSDAGAHVNLIFDAVAPTYQLMHWVRDRSRGPKLPIELIVHKQTQATAELFGMYDRGSISVGKRADINLIDLANLQLGKLAVHNDLPAGGGRILQSAQGYLNTFVAGVKTRENDEDTGARPGRLIRV